MRALFFVIRCPYLRWFSQSISITGHTSILHWFKTRNFQLWVVITVTGWLVAFTLHVEHLESCQKCLLVKIYEGHEKCFMHKFNRSRALCGVLKMDACVTAKHKVILSWSNASMSELVLFFDLFIKWAFLIKCRISRPYQINLWAKVLCANS